MSERSTSPSIIERRAFDLARSANFRSWLTETKPFRTIPTATAPDRRLVGVVVMNLWTRSGVPAGEYRLHMPFRAIPGPTPVAQSVDDKPKGVQFQLTPVYGVTIPVIIRLGNLEASAGIANVQLEHQDNGAAVGLDLTRTGSRSTYGEVRVLKAGVKDPIALQKGIAIYTEVARRHVSIPLAEAYKAGVTGPVTVEYIETFDDGTHLLAQTQAVLR